MKARLEFNCPEEQDDFLTAARADATKRAIEDLRDQIRARLKYGPEPDNDFVDEIYRQTLEIAPYN